MGEDANPPTYDTISRSPCILWWSREPLRHTSSPGYWARTTWVGTFLSRLLGSYYMGWNVPLQVIGLVLHGLDLEFLSRLLGSYYMGWNEYGYNYDGWNAMFPGTKCSETSAFPPL